MSYECFKNLLFLPPNPLKCSFYESYISSNVADIAFYHIHLGFAKKSKLLMILLYIEFQFEFVFVTFARAVNAERASNCWWMKKKADLIKLDTWTSSRWLLSLSSKEKLHLSFWVGILVIIIIIIFLLKMDRFGVECGYHFLDLLWRLGACWCLIELRFIVNSWLCNKIKHLSHRHKSLKYRIRGSSLDSYWIKASKAFRTEMTTP